MRPQVARSSTRADRYAPVPITFQKDVPTTDPHQAALAVIGQVCARLGHELRSPIGAALMHAGLVEMQLRAGERPADLRQAVSAIKQQMIRLDALIARLTRDVVPESRDPVVQRQDVDLRKLVPRMIAELTAGDPALRRQVRARLEGDLTGRWDPAALEEVLGNLVSNALKFGEDRPVHLSVLGEGEWVRILVQDHGIGIAAADQRRIFERFQRAVPPRSYPGLGLGLWAVRQLVEAHGGKVNVFSAPGAGSLFKVTLPRR